MKALTKPAVKYSYDERAAIYLELLNEEFARLKPQPEGLTLRQQAAVRGRATRRFLAMGF